MRKRHCLRAVSGRGANPESALFAIGKIGAHREIMKKSAYLVRGVGVGLLVSSWVVACATGESLPVDGGTGPDATVPIVVEDAAVGFDSAIRSDGSTDATPTDASTCATPCGLAPQCGCNSSDTCDLDDTGKKACVPSGTGLAGRPCLGTRECARGLVCANGVCRAPCETAGAACVGPREGKCGPYPKSETDGGPTVEYTACAVTCDYGDEASCGFKQNDLLAAACVYRPSTNAVECLKVRNVQLQSGLCNADAECGAGRVCIPQTGFSTCRRLCKVGDPTACGGCGGFATPRVVAGVTYGFCP